MVVPMNAYENNEDFPSHVCQRLNIYFRKWAYCLTTHRILLATKMNKKMKPKQNITCRLN